MFNKNLDTILRTFTKAQKELDTFIDRAKQEAELHISIANAAVNEAERATKVRNNLEKIVG